MADGPDRAVSAVYASAGRAAIAPDYLGLGTSPGRHPDTDARSSASASLDMLRAAHSAAPKLKKKARTTRCPSPVSPREDRWAMELGRELNRCADPRRSAPGCSLRSAGPYDLDAAVNSPQV